MDDAGAALLELEAVKGLASYTANVSGNRDGGKKKTQLEQECAAGSLETLPVSPSLLSVQRKAREFI